MKRAWGIVFCILSMALASWAQQVKNPVTTVVKEILARQSKNITAAVEAMPPDKFSYKPTPEQMSFGHLVTHIVESNNMFCSLAANEAPPPIKAPEETASKDILLGAVRRSFDYCTAALDRADDSRLGDTIEVFGGRKEPRAFAFIAIASSMADHYGAAAMYLRLNGILPPTAQKKAGEMKHTEEKK
jgi:uncharacterized damage-inducible protein DinB